MKRLARRDVNFLLDILLSSVNPEKVDDDLGWRIAESCKMEKLYTRSGRLLLLKAVKLCEPEKLRENKYESR